MAAFTNPLASLYGGSDLNKGYDFTYLHYPIKFDDIASQGHYMNFYINTHVDSQYINNRGKKYVRPESKGLFGIDSLGGGKVKSTFNSIVDDFGANSTGMIRDVENTLFGSGGSGNSIGSNSNVTKRITSAISLYIPENISFGGRISWNEESITARMGDFKHGYIFSELGESIQSVNDKIKQYGGVSKWLKTGNYDIKNLNLATSGLFNMSQIGGLGKGIFGSDFSSNDFQLGKSGFAFNPQILVLFTGTGLRDFRFDFFFTPSNETEATAVKNIIKMFRFHAAPEVAGKSGKFYLAPSTFDIEFFHKGKRNENIHQISTCALTSYNVDYSPGGWSTYTDGMPVQTHLALHFMEMEIIDRDKVNDGY